MICSFNITVQSCPSPPPPPEKTDVPHVRAISSAIIMDLCDASMILTLSVLMQGSVQPFGSENVKTEIPEIGLGAFSFLFLNK
jgi:hypothetical protein